MLLPNPLSQNTSGRGNDVRARDPIGEILLVQNHQRNLISSFLPSGFCKYVRFVKRNIEIDDLKKEKSSVKLVNRTLIGRFWGEMPEMGGRKKEKKE